MKCALCGEEIADPAVGCPRCDAGTARSSADSQAEDRAGADSGATRKGRRKSSAARSNAAAEPLAGGFPPGRVVAGRYRLVCLLGSGGMGEVYRAEDLRLGQEVALKFLSPAWETDATMRERFLDEVRLARRVSHAHVCRVYDVGEVDGRLFLSMEYVEGEDLKTLLKRVGRLPRERALAVSRQICGGLAAIHEQGILHRDLKPSNVMIDGEGRPRLTDFGVAVLADAAPAEDGSAGTPAYMAPEQLRGRSATIRSDLFSLGLVIHELFTGRWPLREPAEGEEPDPAVERVVRWCLAEDPRDRPASAEAVAAALVADDGLETGTFLRTVVVSDRAGAEGGERVARRLLFEHGGRELSTAEGPAWLFERPWGAVCFALACRQAGEGGAAAARIGVHLGEVALRRRSRRGAADVGPLVAEGPGVTTAWRLAAMARQGQTLLTAHAFDLARHNSVDEVAPEGRVRWLSHGSYLLRGDEEATEIFEVGVEDLAPLTAPESSEEATAVLGQGLIPGWRPAPGATIPQRPHWKIERKLGEGGFGDMWLGRHAKTREARVFKFCYDASRLRALQREITIFRLLKEQLGDRPDVTRILDWNFDEAPYFIESDYTAGGSLEEWAEQQGGLERVPLEVRLEIVAQVATALSAAHSVGVLHKDVKPGNVLIAAAEGGAVRAQLSDFGIGLVTDRERLAAAGITVLGLSEGTEQIRRSSLSGTRLYMAPEVLEGKPPTLQADVYALGVVLYQMVVGDFSRALAPGWDRDVDDEILREDVAAAVDGSPQRRLGNAHELAERLRTLERRRTERATQRRARERAERGQRQRRLMTAAIVVLVLFGGGMTERFYRVDREAERANRGEAAARQVSDFLVDLFKVTDPYNPAKPGQSSGETVTAREILDRGAEQVETDLAQQPEIQARLMNTIGTIYTNLELREEAEPLLREALKIRQQLFGDEHLAVAESLNDLALFFHDQGDYEQAEELYREALGIRRRLFRDHHADLAESLNNLALVLHHRGEYEQAEPFYREALEMRQRLLGDTHPDVAQSLHNLASLLQAKAEYDRAEPLYRQSLAIVRQLLGDAHPHVATSLSKLASLLRDKGDYDGAERLCRESLQIRKRVFGEEHPHVATSLNELALILQNKEDYEGAEPLLRQSLALRQRLWGDEHPDVAESLNNLASLLQAQGNYEEAELRYRQALTMIRGSLGDEHPHVAICLHNLGDLLQAQGDYEDAEPLFREALTIFRQALGEAHPHVATCLTNLAWVLQAQADYEGAELLYREALTMRQQLFGEQDRRVARSLSRLAWVLQAQADYEGAELLYREALAMQQQLFGGIHQEVAGTLASLAWLHLNRREASEAETLIRQALDAFRQTLPADHWRIANAESILGASLTELERYSEAEPLLVESYPSVRDGTNERSPYTRTALERLVTLYEAWGKPEEAGKYRRLLVAANPSA